MAFVTHWSGVGGSEILIRGLKPPLLQCYPVQKRDLPAHPNIQLLFMSHILSKASLPDSKTTWLSFAFSFVALL